MLKDPFFKKAVCLNLCLSLFSNKVAQVLSYEFREISKNIILTEHLQEAASFDRSKFKFMREKAKNNNIHVFAIFYSSSLHWLMTSQIHFFSCICYVGCPAKNSIQHWRSKPNIFFQQKSSNIYKYNTLMNVILIITSFFN